MHNFPLPVTLFSRDLTKACSLALDEAMSVIEGRDEPQVLGREVRRFALANGIVIAATLGIRKQAGLVKAALDHFAQLTAWSLPLLQQVSADRANGATGGRGEQHFLYRAEEIRTAVTEISSAECREVLLAVARDYERLARTAALIETSRGVLARSNRATASTNT